MTQNKLKNLWLFPACLLTPSDTGGDILSIAKEIIH